MAASQYELPKGRIGSGYLYSFLEAIQVRDSTVMQVLENNYGEMSL